MLRCERPISIILPWKRAFCSFYLAIRYLDSHFIFAHQHLLTQPIRYLTLPSSHRIIPQLRSLTTSQWQYALFQPQRYCSLASDLPRLLLLFGFFFFLFCADIFQISEITSHDRKFSSSCSSTSTARLPFPIGPRPSSSIIDAATSHNPSLPLYFLTALGVLSLCILIPFLDTGDSRKE